MSFQKKNEIDILTLGAAMSAGGGGGTGDGDMKKAVYDTNNDGVVDAADTANSVSGHTVAKDVPADAVFTDTVYDDTALSGRVTALESHVTQTGDVVDSDGHSLHITASAIETEKTVSGNPIVITDALPVPAKLLNTTIEPIQDLHGYDKPWAGGADVNKLNLKLSEIKAANSAGTWTDNVYNYRGVDFTVYATNDIVSSIKINGIATGGLAYLIVKTSSQDISLVNGTSYILSSDNANIGVNYYDGTSHGALGSITFTQSVSIQNWSIAVAENAQVTNVTSRVMIRLATVTDPTYRPYSNICPISGRTEARVKSNNENLLPNTYSSVTRAGITWTVNADGSVRATGSTGNAASGFSIPLNDFRGNFYFTGCPNGGTSSTYDVYAWDNVTNVRPKQWNGTSQILSDFGHTLRQIQIVNNTDLVLRVNTNQSNVDLLFTPMLCLPTADSADFVPYKASSATIQLGQTVYGADINWDTGEMTVKTAKVVMNGQGDFAPNKWATSGSHSYRWYSATIATGDYINDDSVMSSYLEKQNGEGAGVPAFAQSTSSTSQNLYIFNADMLDSSIVDTTTLCAYLQNNPLEVTYKLATPTTLQLTPTQLQMLKGYNRVTIDGGTITLTYRANKADSVQAEVDALDANKAEKTTIAPVENSTKASKAYAVGEHFIRDSEFCTAIAAIASGATLTLNTNYVEGTIADNLIKQATFSGSTNSSGSFKVLNDTSRKILYAEANDNIIAIPFVYNEETYLHAAYAYSLDNVTQSTTVSGTYYYI